MENRTAEHAHFEAYAGSGAWQSYYREPLNPKNCAFALRLEHIARLMRSVGSEHIVDVGCGTGDFVRVLPQTAMTYRGIDFAEAMIASAKDDPTIQSAADISFEVGDVLALEPTEQYDTVVSSGLIEYFDDQAEVAKRLSGLVKPGGHVIVQVPNREFYKWRRPQAVEPSKGFLHRRNSGTECDALFSGLSKVSGEYVNLDYYRGSNMRPRLHVALNRVLPPITPIAIKRMAASMYIGLYRKRM
jgi:SAM-dependent methyltransferase